MKVGVDATSWVNGRGYGRFVRELLPRMVERSPGDEFLFFIESTNAARLTGLPKNARIVPVDLGKPPTEAAAADGARSPGDMLTMTKAVKSEHVDVFFFPTVYTYFPMPLGQRMVVTIHDAIAERFPHLTLPNKKARLFWNAKVWLAKRQARLVLTVSDFAARELTEVLKIPASRLRVTGEAPSAEFRPSESTAEIAAAAEKIGLPADARWLVYVGGFNPHKHVDSAIRAHATAARGSRTKLFLLLVGTLTGDVFMQERSRLEAIVRECGTESTVRWTGFVPDRELRHLLSGAVATLLPSANEGFGLPTVEAAACACPVIATKMSPLPELLSGGGEFIAPADSDAMARTISKWLVDETLRKSLGERARACAAAMSWDLAADRANACLREAAK